MAIGIGDMRIVNTEQGIWDGEAIYLSGRALEEMSSLNKGTMSVHTSKKQLSAPLQTIALLTDAILNNMTVRLSEVVYYKLLGLKEAGIAKKLWISPVSYTYLIWNVIVCKILKLNILKEKAYQALY